MNQRTPFIRLRKALTPNERRHFAHKTALHLPRLLGRLPRCANIALYYDSFGELPCAPIVAFCLKNGFSPHLPIIQGNKLAFTPIATSSFFYPFNDLPQKHHKLGMKEPIASFCLPAWRMNAIFCPLTVIDKRGNRVGMGGGFYDKTLKDTQALTIGWCYSFQVVEHLNKALWDMPMDIILTDKRAYFLR